MKVGFTDKAVTESIFDIDRFSMKTKETTRICCIDPDVDVQIVHYVNFGEDPQTKRGYKENGYYRCLGRYEVIFGTETEAGRGSDAEKCEFCQVQVRYGVIGLASPRYAANIARYMTDAKGTLMNFNGGFGYEFLPWIFGPDKFRRLNEIRKLYGNAQAQHPLQFMDLVVTCLSETFQKMQIDPAAPCCWLSAPDPIKAQFIQEWKAKRRTDLDDLLGKVADAVTIHKLVETSKGVVQQAPAGVVAQIASVSDVQQLLDRSTPTPVAGVQGVSLSFGSMIPPATPTPVNTAVQTPHLFTSNQPNAPIQQVSPAPTVFQQPPQQPTMQEMHLPQAPPQQQPSAPTVNDFENLLKL